MPLKVWNGSAWTQASTLRVWNGSSWVSAQSGKVWNGSSWVEFYSAATPGTASLTAHTISAEAVSYNLANASSFAKLEVDIDKILYGSVSMTTGNGEKIGQIDSTSYAATALDQVLESWTTGTPSLWSCRAVTISAPGAGLSGDSRDTWLPLTSARSWTVSAASSSSPTYQSRTFTFTLQLALTSNTSNVLASANMSLTATAQSNAGPPP